MATLTQAVEIGDSELHINTPLSAGQVPGFVKIDDELLEVGGQDNLAGTTLVLATPAKEEHDSGATVTYAGRPYDPTFKTALAGAGGEQTVRLLGPYTVTHATPDLDSGAVIATLPDEAVVVRVSIFLTATWSLTTELGVWITDAALEHWTDALAYTTERVSNPDNNAAWSQEVFNVAMGQFPALYTDKAEPPLVLTGVDAKLVTVATNAPSQGEAAIYVLIAEPAA